ncbi:retrovirus-related pol polyprotein from transposon TNT 1-94 [Tanacetum coccineum]
MANLSEDIQCAGSDTRPPMLDRTDFASWQQRIRLYFQDKDRYNANIRATNILLQGLPKDIYTLINHYTEAKDIWDNGRQNRGQGNNARGAGADGYGGSQNRVGNATSGQARQIKCYNCNGIGHIARNCT